MPLGYTTHCWFGLGSHFSVWFWGKRKKTKLERGRHDYSSLIVVDQTGVMEIFSPSLQSESYVNYGVWVEGQQASVYLSLCVDPLQMGKLRVNVEC